MISQIRGESQHNSESEKKGQESEMKISPSTKKTENLKEEEIQNWEWKESQINNYYLKQKYEKN